MDGLKRFYGVEDERALQFYVVHQDMDRWHSQVERELIISSQTDLSEVRVAAEKACRALWGFLDGVYLATCLARERASNSDVDKEAGIEKYLAEEIGE
jgi:pyrroloquinoline-quinone synthase